MITIKQIKAARALLGWKQSDLAKRSGFSLPAINNIEREISDPKTGTLEIIQQSFEENGIEFKDQTGVSLKGEHLKIYKFEGTEGLLRLLDDVYNTLKHSKGEVLISGLDESAFVKRLGKKLYEHLARLKKANIKERLLISEKDDVMIAPKESYRHLSNEIFSQTPYYVYEDKCAFVLWGPPLKVIMIHNKALSKSFRKQFEYNWKQAKI